MSKLEQLRGLRERGQGGVRSEPKAKKIARLRAATRPHRSIRAQARRADAGAYNGEDSAGRAKGRKLTPIELVNEAVEVADLAVEEFRRRGWVIELPSFADIENAKIVEE